MEPNIWGPGAWLFLHSVTLNYPDNPTNIQKKQYKDFFYSLVNILPCSKCQKNYENHINEYPINFHLNSKEALSRWLVKIHNMVNKINNKKTLKYKDFISNMSDIYDQPIKSISYYKKKNKYQMYVIYVLMLTLILLMFLKITKYL